MKKSRKIWEQCAEHRLWFLLLLVTDLLFVLSLWLIDAPGFFALAGLMTFLMLIMLAAAVFLSLRKEKIREQRMIEFLSKPDEETEARVCKSLAAGEERRVHAMAKLLDERERDIREQSAYRQEYEAYVESWAHEVKTPLSLMTLILDNRQEEMSPEVYERLEYIRSQMQGYVEQMLYYARLGAEHKNYFFESVSLSKCCAEVLEEFQTLLEEQGITVMLPATDAEVLTDKKSLVFMLGQVLSNAVKYKDQKKENPVIWLEITESSGKEPQERSGKESAQHSIILTVRDNGTGVRACDLPFIFEKGFTGDSGEEKKTSTGMGLYLISRLAAELNIQVDAESRSGEGFEFRFAFPCV